MPTRPPTLRYPWQRNAEQRRAENDAARGGPRRRGYDRAWERVRELHLAIYPGCSVAGCATPFDRVNVDHLQSVAEAPHRRLDRTNLRTLCQSHHSARTSRDHSWNGRR